MSSSCDLYCLVYDKSDLTLLHSCHQLQVYLATHYFRFQVQLRCLHIDRHSLGSLNSVVAEVVVKWIDSTIDLPTHCRVWEPAILVLNVNQMGY